MKEWEATTGGIRINCQVDKTDVQRTVQEDLYDQH